MAILQRVLHCGMLCSITFEKRLSRETLYRETLYWQFKSVSEDEAAK